MVKARPYRAMVLFAILSGTVRFYILERTGGGRRHKKHTSFSSHFFRQDIEEGHLTFTLWNSLTLCKKLLPKTNYVCQQAI